jgi:CheY-like chemotaxis protein
MSKMLCRLGHHVSTAKHGKEGLDMINAAYRLTPDSPSIDIVFLDK